MKKSNLLNNISRRTGISRAVCETVIDTMVDEITGSLISGERVAIKGFMTFDLGARAERRARNPSTGDIVLFPAVKTVKCKMSREIKNAINNK